MEKKDLKIVFFGTPDFAVESLKRLVEGGYNVVGVVTMPDKPAGRGHHLFQSDVKKYAVENGLHLMQPVKLKDEEFVNELRSLNADLFIVIAFLKWCGLCLPLAHSIFTPLYSQNIVAQRQSTGL